MKLAARLRPGVGLLAVGLALGALGFVPAFARGQAPCQAAESFPTRNEICADGCWEEGAPEEQARAAEADHADELQEACEAQEAAEEGREAREREQEARRHQREAREWERKPTVKRWQAHAQVLHLLATEGPGWHRRTVGAIDCRGGKINRINWTCRARWLNGNVCRRGRFRVTGAGHRDGTAFYSIHGNWLIGPGYLSHGYLYCF